MINASELEQYFPQVNTPITEDDYTFTIALDDSSDTFIINLRIKQKDTKESHLIKFRLGIGKDKPTNSLVHDTSIPHFEIDYYSRQVNSFSATVYFTFNDTNDELLLAYAKGTVVLIAKILDLFIHNHHLSKNLLQNLVYYSNVVNDLLPFEKTLIDGLYSCYKKQNLVVREDGKKIVINTPHNLEKYLNQNDLQPLYLSLKEMAKSE
ncbi:MAG: hypothetical protein V1859_04720 [archaeon]